MSRFDSTRKDFAPYGLTCVRWTPEAMTRADRHNEIELNLLQSGSVTYLFGGQRMKIEANCLTAFWGGIPHQVLDFRDTGDYYVATIPVAWIMKLQIADSLVQPLFRGAVLRSPDSAQAPLDQHLFSRWVRDLAQDRRDLRRAALAELEGRLLRLLVESAAQRSPASPARNRGTGRAEPNHVEDLAFFIAQHYTERITAEDIGRSVGLHPNYAMGLFKRAFGTTLVDYLTHHRISHAQRMLITSDARVLEICLSSGFGSMSRFQAAFLRECGSSPTEFRLRHRLAA
jgi:AraC family transcriptional regulator, melibiose operon regulatory protein